MALCLLAVQHHHDLIVADLQSVAMGEPVGTLDPHRSAVDECAIGRHVIEPIAAVLVPHLTMMPRDEALRVWQAPIEMLFTADVEPPRAGRELDRPAIG